MSLIRYQQSAPLVDLPDMVDENNVFICKRKGECVQMSYEPIANIIRVVYDVVPFDRNGQRISSGSNIQPYRVSTVADSSTFVKADTGEYLCESVDVGNPILLTTDYMYDYEWYNKQGWTEEINVVQLISQAIYDSFMRTEFPPSSTSEQIYNSIKTPLPISGNSENYQAGRIAELGQQITLAGSKRTLTSATVRFNTWGYHTKYPQVPDNTWNCDITLNLYAVNSGNQSVPGQKLLSVTRTFAIQWRPEPDAICGDTRWNSGTEGCKSGMAFSLDFGNLDSIILPDELIFGLAFDTQNAGVNPIGSEVPQNDLALSVNGDNPPSLGIVPPNPRFVNSSEPTAYADGGAAGINTFRKDVGAADYPIIAIAINAK